MVQLLDHIDLFPVFIHGSRAVHLDGSGQTKRRRRELFGDQFFLTVYHPVELIALLRQPIS